ncbi:hypothetical protein EC991_006654 [Linnemannia zychae]|nr:hypothetical protein EC991_006654 [Linnemannia zychae]
MQQQQQQKSSPSTPLPLLKPISPDAGYADYLAELTQELPFSASQFGIVLVSALELRDCKRGRQDTKSKGPNEAAPTWEPTVDSPHFQCSLPVKNAAGKDVLTNIDVTIAGHANTLYVRSEFSLMQAAAAAAPFEDNTVDSHYSFKATAENFTKALESDHVVQGHQNNVVAVMNEILEHPVSKNTPPGQDEANLQFFYCLNDIWQPALKTFGKLSDGNRGVKHVISEEQLLKDDPEIRRRCQELEENDGLVLGPMVESDVPLMIASNGVKYDDEYVSIAALHVLPEYRKTGLGRLILHGLAMTHVKLAREILDTKGDGAEHISPKTLVAHADCMDYNLATMVFMKRCGWQRIGFYLWIGVDKSLKD